MKKVTASARYGEWDISLKFKGRTDMGRHSIKFKITLMLTIIISSLLVLLMILNSTMSEKFYLNGRRKQMLEGYTYINNTIVSTRAGHSARMRCRIR